MLQAIKLEKYYGKHIGIKDVSFEVHKGEVLGVIGTNGSGKTTTFRILLGLIHQDSGIIKYEGKQISREDICLFGYLPEERSIYRDLTVYQQIDFLCRLKGMSQEDRLEQMDRWLNKLEVIQYKHRKLKELSKGNQQKIQLICAMIHNPQIVILDEPLTGLDLYNVNLMKTVIEEFKKEGKIILLSSHQYDYLEQFCDQVLFLKQGEVKFKKEMYAFYDENKTCYVTLNQKDIDEEFNGYLINYENEQLRIKFEDLSKAKAFVSKMLKNNRVESVVLTKSTLKDLIQEKHLL